MVPIATTTAGRELGCVGAASRCEAHPRIISRPLLRPHSGFRIVVLLFVAGSNGCSGQGADTAAEARQFASVSAIDARVDSIDRYLAAHRDQLKLYARLPKVQELVPVKIRPYGPTDWSRVTTCSRIRPSG
jgi:hypothetical protein